MDALATTQDVEANWRQLRGQEVTNAESWLEHASAELRVQVAGLDDRMGTDESYDVLARGAVVMAVRRMLRGADRGDPATYDTIFFARAELAGLISTADAQSPIGSFPALVPLPSVW